MNQDALVDEVLVLGEQDLIQASEIASVVIESYGSQSTDEKVMRASIWIVRRLLEQGFATVGDAVLEEKGGEEIVKFKPWNVPAEVALQRIEVRWHALPRGPSLGDVCWLELTAKGKQRAASASLANDSNDSGG